MTNIVTLQTRLEDLLKTASDMQKRNCKKRNCKRKKPRVRGGDYASFAIMAAGIELLGCLCDEDDISKSGLSKYRFTNAIRCFFPKPYHDHAERLYQLRCCLLHVCRPVGGVVLCSRGAGDREEHLSTVDGNLYLVAEDLLSDLQNAVQNAVKKASRNPRYKCRLRTAVMHTGT